MHVFLGSEMSVSYDVCYIYDSTWSLLALYSKETEIFVVVFFSYVLLYLGNPGFR
jgi:hypothetical protein